ncbi:MAG: hypothetical protein ACREIY_03815 [Candidatus Rokuibacteriota bacterium]
MAEEIRRVGPPRATELRGEEFTWMVQLNQPPSREWTRVFSEPAETTVMCLPKKLGMMHQALVFKSEDAHLAVWVQYIDKWIGGANQALVDAERQEKQRKAEQLRQDEDKKRRIDAVNEKYKAI